MGVTLTELFCPASPETGTSWYTGVTYAAKTFGLWDTVALWLQLPIKVLAFHEERQVLG